MVIDNERFKRFERHIDNIEEVVSAEDFNELAEGIENEERQRFVFQDSGFVNKALFVMQNHVEANSLWYDDFSDKTKIDTAKTTLYYNEDEASITFDENDLMNGWLYSKPYDVFDDSNVQRVMLMVNEYLPERTLITYYISNNNTNWYAIHANEGVLIDIPVSGTRLSIRAKMTRMDKTSFPRIDAWALIFVNPKINQITLDPSNPDDDIDPGVVAIPNIYHKDLLDIKPDDHHSVAHLHNNDDGSGVISHEFLTNVGIDDHHTKIHHHSSLDGENPKINLATEVEGYLPMDSLPFDFIFGIPGLSLLDYNLAGKVISVIGPDEEVYLVYDLDGNLDKAVTIKFGVASIETLIRVDGRLTGVNKEVKDAVEADVQAIITLSRSVI